MISPKKIVFKALSPSGFFLKKSQNRNEGYYSDGRIEEY